MGQDRGSGRRPKLMARSLRLSWTVVQIRRIIQSAHGWVDGNHFLLQSVPVAPKTNRLRPHNESGRLRLRHLLRIRRAQSPGSDSRLLPGVSLDLRRACSNPSEDSFASQNAVQISSCPIGAEIVVLVLRTIVGRERGLFHALPLTPSAWPQAAPMVAGRT